MGEVPRHRGEPPPGAWIGFALWSDLTRNTRFLGANPVKEMEHFMGEWNIRFLVLTLAVTPVIKLTGWGWLIRYRRIFGLLAFFYIFLPPHASTSSSTWS